MIKLKSLFRRGQGPSGSKHSSNSNNTQQLKSASSASSSDNIDSTGIITKPSKHYQDSKQRSDQKYRGSRDKLGSRESLDVKESTKQIFQPDNHQPRLQSMPLIQQQHVGNNNMIDQRDVSNYSVDPLADINFDGPKEVCKTFLLLFFKDIYGAGTEAMITHSDLKNSLNDSPLYNHVSIQNFNDNFNFF